MEGRSYNSCWGNGGKENEEEKLRHVLGVTVTINIHCIVYVCVLVCLGFFLCVCGVFLFFTF